MKAKLMLCLCLLLASTAMFAQGNLTVTGVVTEKATGYPAIGVSVLVKGTTIGTVTSMDGDYSLSNVPANATLVFSYVGMLTQEHAVGNRTVINVMIEEDTQKLDEVVVIGYGTSKAKDLTAPIAVIKADDIVKHATTSPMGALQGKVAGVHITNSGQPGSGPDVRIRGVGSFGDTKPLYVVDGMFFDNIDFLNNSDIQDLSILKDASAASIYGVRAANGVVIVTTKKGTLNKPATITYDGYVGFQQVTNQLKMANSKQYATMQIEKNNATDLNVLRNSIELFGGDLQSMMPGTSTDWYDELLRTALIHNHSIDISGGTDKASYSVGMNYMFQEGIMDAKNEYERLNIRAKADYNVNNWLKIGANTVISNGTKYSPNNAAWGAAYLTPGIFPVMDERRSDADVYPVKYASPSQIGMSTYYGNPVATANYYDNKSNTIQVLPTFYAQIDFLPANKLFFKTAYSQDISFIQGRIYTPQYLVGGSQLSKNSNLKKEDNNYRSWILDNTITYRDAFGKHNFSAMLGQSVRSENWRYLWGNATGVPGGSDEYKYLDQGNADGRTTGDNGTTYRGLSYFGRVTYDYQGKYLLSATMRADGSSKYQEKWGYFPSIGAAWNISEEDFMKDFKQLNYLKLRASWGKLGNDKVSASDGFASVTQNMNTSGVFGNGVLPGYTNLVYFSYLDWEVVNELNIGFDAAFLDSRLGVEADYYHRLTENAVINAPLPMGAGSLLGNNGEILNSGLELSVDWTDKIGKNFSYSIGANITTLKNKVKNLNGLPYLYGGSAEFRTISKVGGELNAYYGHEIAGVYQNAAEVANDPIAVANGLEPGDFKYVDQNKDGKIDDNDRVILGSYIPNFTYGMNLGLSYKKFDLSVVLQGQTGNEIVNRKRGNRRWQSDINYDSDMVENRWTGEGSTNSYPSAKGSVKPWNISKFNSFYVEDGSYFRVQNIQMAYTFDKLKFSNTKLPSVRLSLTAERPYTYFKSNGFTPEVGNNGFDDQVYPLAATYTLGLRIIY